MITEQELTSYDYFCEFAWERLEDVCGLVRAKGLPSLAPYVEFVEGCAFTCLFDLSKGEQEECFGFTLDDLHENLIYRFVDDYSFL